MSLGARVVDDDVTVVGQVVHDVFVAANVDGNQGCFFIDKSEIGSESSMVVPCCSTLRTTDLARLFSFLAGTDTLSVEAFFKSLSFWRFSLAFLGGELTPVKGGTLGGTLLELYS